MGGRGQFLMLWKQSKNPKIRMGAMKNYLITLLQQCSEENFGQEAVEWAILSGHLKLTYEMVTDLHQIFDQRSLCCDAPPLNGETCNHAGICRHCRDHTTFITSYDEFCDAYRAHCREQEALEAQLVESYAPVLQEILRPIPALDVEHSMLCSH
jgi:hypothetical protein